MSNPLMMGSTCVFFSPVADFSIKGLELKIHKLLMIFFKPNIYKLHHIVINTAFKYRNKLNSKFIKKIQHSTNDYLQYPAAKSSSKSVNMTQIEQDTWEHPRGKLGL